MTSSSRFTACPTTTASGTSITCCGETTASRWDWSRPSAPRRIPAGGQRQAELYADCLETQFGRRPVIFYTNGYQHWLWDDAMYPPRSVQGFYTKDELELLIQRRTTRRSLAEPEIDKQIVERYYQTEPSGGSARAFETDLERKALLVMATGAGKTRTVIALADLLMRCNWVKRVLFLADRVALVNQAVGAFKTHLPVIQPREPGDRTARRGPRLRVDLSHDDGPHQRDVGRPRDASAPATSISSSSTRPTAPSIRSTAPSSNTSIVCSSG